MFCQKTSNGGQGRCQKRATNVLGACCVLVVMLSVGWCPDGMARQGWLRFKIHEFGRAIENKTFEESGQILTDIQKRHPRFSRQGMCSRLIKAAMDALAFEAVVSFVESHTCMFFDLEGVTRGIRYLALAKQWKALDVYLGWLKDYPDQKERLDAFLSLLTSGSLSPNRAMKVVQSFSFEAARQTALLAFVSFFPFEGIMKRFIAYGSAKHKPKGGVNALIRISYELMTRSEITVARTENLFGQCEVWAPETVYEDFWKSACAYFAKQRHSGLAEAAQKVLSSTLGPSMFHVLNQNLPQGVHLGYVWSPVP